VRNVDEAVILVTGATDGLGKRVAHDLALKGATVLLHGRDRARGEAAMREIREEMGNDNSHYYLADFSSLEQVRRLAEEIQADHERLDVLINNAGIGAGTDDARREVSQDGHELRFAVNYLAPFLLTRLLLPLLHRSAPSRIVNVASVGQSPIDFDNPMLEQRYDGMRAYSQSKLALVMFTFDLAEQLAGTGVSANSLHPASLMDTKMVFESFGYTMSTVQQGTDATVRLATSPELEGVTGRYFDGQREARANEQAYDRDARDRLRRLSEELAGLNALDTSP
jgi:NAD(P)-dependent dehydrogenase (short-subunit alcohol dehydrogenase family)